MVRPVAIIVSAGLLAGCGSAAASTQPPERTATPAPAAAAPTAAAPTATPAAAAASTPAATPARAARAAAPIDRLTRIARLRYAVEAHGATARAKTRRVGSDPMLRRLLRSGNLAALRTYVRRRFTAVWYGWHVSRMRILRGSKVLVEVGVPFVVAPSQMTLPGGYTLQVSIQDEIGFCKFTYRNDHVFAVVRGRGGEVRTLLPAAAHAHLPVRGHVTLAGRRYAVGSFAERAWNGEPVTVWILVSA
jgi:hypothetical protein